jgi:hypothetical protein
VACVVNRGIREMNALSKNAHVIERKNIESVLFVRKEDITLELANYPTLLKL